MSRIRIDNKRRKVQQNNNIVDFDIAQLNKNKNEKYYSYSDKRWQIKFKKGIIYTNKISSEEKFKERFELINDFHFFIDSNKQLLKLETLRSYFNILKKFLTFCDEKSIKINYFSDINYNVVLQFCNYLRECNFTMSNYDSFRALLKRLSKTEHITTDKDINNNVFPSINLTVTKNNKTSYNEKEFQILAGYFLEVINDYFNNNIPYKTFCKAAYWYIAMHTGLNKTGMDSLVPDSIEELKETEDCYVYWIVGEKNRSSKGHQSSVFAINKKNTLFQKVLEELNNNYNHLDNHPNKTLFSYNGLTGLNTYTGCGNAIKLLKTFKEYSKKNKKTLPFIPAPSTRRIRNFLSASIYHKTKDEQIVAAILGHENLNTTATHYIKYSIDDKIIAKFNIVQEILNCFASNKNYENWVDFQEAFGLKDDNVETIIKKLETGIYESQLGKCIRSSNNEINTCTSYFQCFSCKHFSVIGERDAWKILSFKEALNELKGNSIKYQWIYESIDKILQSLDTDYILKARNTLVKKGKHPFWKNQIMIKNITEQYEANNAI